MTNINNGVLDGTRRIGAKIRDLVVDGGLPGAPLGFRMRGATLAGPPATGTWKAGDLVPDRAGNWWTCTTGGTPGTWATAEAMSPASLGSLPAFQASGVKVRGMMFTPQIQDASWGAYFGTDFSMAFVQQQVAAAIKVGCNTVKVGAMFPHEAGAVTLGTALANAKQIWDYVAAQGLMMYAACLTDVTDAAAWPSNSNWVTQACQLLDRYDNVIGIDLCNEINYNTPAGYATIVPAMFAAARAVTKKPLTMSFSMQAGGSGLAAWGSLSTVTGAVGSLADFIDVHPYYTTGEITTADFGYLASAFPGKLIIFGEVGQEVGTAAPAAEAATRLNAVRPCIEQPACAGGVAFASNDWSSSIGFYGYFDANWNERTIVTYPFRTWPKRAAMPTETMPLVVPSSAVSLTTSLTGVTSAVTRLRTADWAAEPGRDPAWRLTAEFTGATFMDTLTIAGTDPNNSNAVLATASVPALQDMVLQDYGPLQLPGTFAGSPTNPGVVAGPSGGIYTMYTFLDGTLINTTALSAGQVPNAYVVAGQVSTVIGGEAVGNGSSTSLPFVGGIGEVRISNTARYTTTYTPATSPFTSDTNTVLLAHLSAPTIPQRVSTPWAYVPPYPQAVQLALQNATEAAGTVTSAALEVRYA